MLHNYASLFLMLYWADAHNAALMVLCIYKYHNRYIIITIGYLLTVILCHFVLLFFFFMLHGGYMVQP